MSFLRCPLCHDALETDEKTARCHRGHSFDRAREGYFNLLPVQKKNSLDPGDDADMVAARHEFLEAGFYAPFRDTLCSLIAPLKPIHLLDSGCGEGWYSSALAAHSANTTAFDISKNAVRRAAKRQGKTRWLVAGSHDIPLQDASADVMTAIFSPVSAAEAARVLNPGGQLLIAAPGDQHLHELRAALYEEVRPHKAEKWTEMLSPHFSLHSETQVRFGIELNNKTSLQSLLKMTPHYWRAAREKRNVVEALAQFATQADFRILRFQRNDKAA
jgi:23S rRNA (guanine745-N1)-methyltransferase